MRQVSRWVHHKELTQRAQCRICPAAVSLKRLAVRNKRLINLCSAVVASVYSIFSISPFQSHSTALTILNLPCLVVALAEDGLTIAHPARPILIKVPRKTTYVFQHTIFTKLQP